jgi:hypothetical protein
MDVGNWSDPEVRAYLEANTAWKNMQREKAGLPPLEAYGGSGGGWVNYKKKITARKISTPKAKVANIKVKKLPKIKIAKAPKIKSLKTKKIKVGKLPLTAKTIKTNIKIKA